MSFIPDEQEKTVKIPVQVRACQIQFYFDGPLPDLKEGVIGDLVLPRHAVLDPKARKLFSEERKIPLFKKKTLLYVQLRPETDDAKPFDAHLLRPYPKGTRFYVELHQKRPVGVNPWSLRSTIIHSICFASLRESNFRMSSICNCGAPKPLPSVIPRARYRLSRTRRRTA